MGAVFSRCCRGPAGLAHSQEFLFDATAEASRLRNTCEAMQPVAITAQRPATTDSGASAVGPGNAERYDSSSAGPPPPPLRQPCLTNEQHATQAVPLRSTNVQQPREQRASRSTPCFARLGGPAGSSRQQQPDPRVGPSEGTGGGGGGDDSSGIGGPSPRQRAPLLLPLHGRGPGLPPPCGAARRAAGRVTLLSVPRTLAPAACTTVAEEDVEANTLHRTEASTAAASGPAAGSTADTAYATTTAGPTLQLPPSPGPTTPPSKIAASHPAPATPSPAHPLHPFPQRRRTHSWQHHASTSAAAHAHASELPTLSSSRILGVPNAGPSAPTRPDAAAPCDAPYGAFQLQQPPVQPAQESSRLGLGAHRATWQWESAAATRVSVWCMRRVLVGWSQKEVVVQSCINMCRALWRTFDRLTYGRAHVGALACRPSPATVRKACADELYAWHPPHTRPPRACGVPSAPCRAPRARHPQEPLQHTAVPSTPARSANSSVGAPRRSTATAAAVTQPEASRRPVPHRPAACAAPATSSSSSPPPCDSPRGADQAAPQTSSGEDALAVPADLVPLASYAVCMEPPSRPLAKQQAPPVPLQQQRQPSSTGCSEPTTPFGVASGMHYYQSLVRRDAWGTRRPGGEVAPQLTLPPPPGIVLPLALPPGGCGSMSDSRSSGASPMHPGPAGAGRPHACPGSSVSPSHPFRLTLLHCEPGSEVDNLLALAANISQVGLRQNAVRCCRAVQCLMIFHVQWRACLCVRACVCTYLGSRFP